MQQLNSSSGPRRAFWLALIFILLVFVEGGSYLVEFLSPRLLVEPIKRRSTILREQTERIARLLDTTRAHREALDSILGWRYRSGYSSASDHINSQGLRARRVYSTVASTKVVRIASFGDSFVYGNEVADDDAWSALLVACDSDFEVLNYGVGGYGVDQAFLRFQLEGMTLHPRVVLIGFTPDDLRRMVNVYRRFISSLELPLAKPRYLLRPDRSLALARNPLPQRDDYRRLMNDPASVRKLGTLDQWYSPTIYENPLYDYFATIRVTHALSQRLTRRFFDPDRLFHGEMFNATSSAFKLQTAVLRAFSSAVRDSGAVPVVLMLPDRSSIERVRHGQKESYRPLTDALRANRVAVWDAMEAFRPLSVPEGTLFASGGHYSPAGNRAVAVWLKAQVDSLLHRPRQPCGRSN